jgi:hypothetical protein
MSHPAKHPYSIGDDGCINVPIDDIYTLIIDQVDLDLIVQYHWTVSIDRGIRIMSKHDRSTILIGRVIAQRMGLDIQDRYIVYIDGNHLNNRRSNISVGSMAKIQQARKTPSTNKSGVKGIFYDTTRCKWVGTITKNGVPKRKRFDLMSDAIQWRKNEEQS